MVRVLAPVLVLFVTIGFAAIVQAGVLDAESGDTTVAGTLLTATWSQGCISGALGSLGLNRCHATQPFFCPLESEGGDDYTEWSASCGCPPNERPDSLGIGCDACLDPCEELDCEDYERCESSGDWCDENAECVCDITTEAEGCSYFGNCDSGETCEYTGGDRCNANNYECVGSDPPSCTCSGNVVCRFEQDPESDDTCSTFSRSAQCQPVSGSSGASCGTTSTTLCNPPPGCRWYRTDNNCDPHWLDEGC